MGKTSKKKEIAKERAKDELALDTMSDHDESGQLIGKKGYVPLVPYSWQQCALIGWEDEAKSSIWERFTKNDNAGHRRDAKHESRKLGVAVDIQTTIEILEQLCHRPEDLQNIPETLQLFFYYAVCAFLQLQYGERHERMKPDIDANPIWETLFYRHTDKDRCGSSVSKGVRLGCLSFIHLHETVHTFPCMISYANSFLLFKELSASLHQHMQQTNPQQNRSPHLQRDEFDRNSQKEYVRQPQFMQEGSQFNQPYGPQGSEIAGEQQLSSDIPQARPVGAGAQQQQSVRQDIPLGGIQ